MMSWKRTFSRTSSVTSSLRAKRLEALAALAQPSDVVARDRGPPPAAPRSPRGRRAAGRGRRDPRPRTPGRWRRGSGADSSSPSVWSTSSASRTGVREMPSSRASSSSFSRLPGLEPPVDDRVADDVGGDGARVSGQRRPAVLEDARHAASILYASSPSRPRARPAEPGAAGTPAGRTLPARRTGRARSSGRARARRRPAPRRGSAGRRDDRARARPRR